MWKLFIGIHRGTIGSRDGEPSKELSSLDECRTEATKAFQWYSRHGYKCWFCYAESPSGEKTTLIPSVPYY